MTGIACILVLSLFFMSPQFTCLFYIVAVYYFYLHYKQSHLLFYFFFEISDVSYNLTSFPPEVHGWWIDWFKNIIECLWHLPKYSCCSYSIWKNIDKNLCPFFRIFFLDDNESLCGVTHTVSPLYRTFRLWTFKDVSVRAASVGPEWNCSLPYISVAMVLQLYHLPLPPRPPARNSSCFFSWRLPLYASCCAGPVHFSRSCTLWLEMF